MTTWLVRDEQAKPSNKYGKHPQERSVKELIDFGVVVIDKPSGPTSHQVSAYVQQALNIDKAGHSGTLDPKVTGVLPVATGNATRLVEYMLKAGKEYVGVMHVHQEIPQYELRKAQQAFIGKISQLPPKRSAVARRVRTREVYDFEFLEIRGRDVLFRADVEAGTYIRKICSDFGAHVGSGAHMAELRRTRASHYTEDQAITLQMLSDVLALAKEGDETAFRTMLLPGEDIVKHLPAVVVLDSAVNSLTHGATLKVPGVAKVQPGILDGDVVRVITLKDELVGMGTARMTSKDMLKEKGVAVKMDKIVLSQDVYPKME